MNQLSRDDMYALTNKWQVPAPLDRIMIGGAYAESGWDADRAGDVVAGVAHSIGLFQLHDQGLGANMSITDRQDPDRQMAVMVPVYRKWYAYWSNPQAHGQGDLPLAEIAWRTCCWAERPYDYTNPNGAAAKGYQRGWEIAASDVRRPDTANRIYPFSPSAQYGRTHWDGLLALDVFDTYGAPIRACASGTAYYHQYPLGGWTVTLTADTDDEAGGAVYYHAHMIAGSGLAAHGGTVPVVMGQQIGLVGDTGNAAGKPSHCHWSAGSRNYGVDVEGAGDVRPAPLLDAWQAAEGSEEVTNPELVNAIGYLAGDVADALQNAHDEMQVRLEALATTDLTDEEREDLNQARAALDSLQDALDTLKTYRAQAEGGDARAEAVRDETAGYRGAPMREPRPEIEGEAAREEREAAEAATADAGPSDEERHRARLADEFGVPPSEVPTDMIRDAVARETTERMRREGPRGGEQPADASPQAPAMGTGAKETHQSPQETLGTDGPGPMRPEQTEQPTRDERETDETPGIPVYPDGAPQTGGQARTWSDGEDQEVVRPEQADMRPESADADADADARLAAEGDDAATDPDKPGTRAGTQRKKGKRS